MVWFLTTACQHVRPKSLRFSGTIITQDTFAWFLVCVSEHEAPKMINPTLFALITEIKFLPSVNEHMSLELSRMIG